MSRDFKEIFDLARLRRAWGDTTAEQEPPPARDDGFLRLQPESSVPAPPVVAAQEALRSVLPPPLVLLDQLQAAVAQEFPEHAAALQYHLDILQSRIHALVGEGAQPTSGQATSAELPSELALAYHADVQENLDQLEDLIDALSLPARSGD